MFADQLQYINPGLLNIVTVPSQERLQMIIHFISTQSHTDFLSESTPAWRGTGLTELNCSGFT